MSFIDEVAVYAEVRHNTCTVGAWLAENPQYDTKQLRDAAEVHSKVAVWRFMQAKGFDKGRTTVERHLTGECKCP